MTRHIASVTYINGKSSLINRGVKAQSGEETAELHNRRTPTRALLEKELRGGTVMWQLEWEYRKNHYCDISIDEGRRFQKGRACNQCKEKI